MPVWLVKLLPIVLPVLILSFVGVVIGGIIQSTFNIPDDVTLIAGVAFAVVPAAGMIGYQIWKRSRKKKDDAT